MARWLAPTRSVFREAVQTIGCSACWCEMPMTSAARRLSVREDWPSPAGNRLIRRTTVASAVSARSSNGAGPSSASPARLKRCGRHLEFERACERDECRQRRIWVLSREEASDHLWAQTCPTSKLRLAQLQAASALIEYPDNAVDLIDAAARSVVGAFVLWVCPAVLQIPLCAGACCCHETCSSVT